MKNFIKASLLSSLIYLNILSFANAQNMTNFISFELSHSKTLHNYFQLPNKDANRVNLPDDKYFNSHRINGRIDLKNDDFLYLVYAPLETDYSFVSNKSFKFDNTDFNSGENTEISYKFNSYRIGYFKKFSASKNFKYWLGGVLKVRDAKIRVRQEGKIDSYRNLGIVPLLGLGGEYFFAKNFSIFSHIDALGSSQGSAYDFNSEIKYHIKNSAVGFGYRTLGGGVDNDKVMNFARFESFYVNYTFGF